MDSIIVVSSAVAPPVAAGSAALLPHISRLVFGDLEAVFRGLAPRPPHPPAPQIQCGRCTSRLPPALRKVGGREDTSTFALCMLVLALAGVVVSPLWFAGHLLLIVKKSDLLHSVIHSVLIHGRSLALTALLTVIVVYLFVVVGYAFFQVLP